MSWIWKSHHDWRVRAVKAEEQAATLTAAVNAAGDHIREMRDERIGKNEQIEGLSKQLTIAIESPSYLVKRDSGETWNDYQRRVAQILWEGRTSPFFRAILDELGRQERQAHAAWLDETDSAKAERLRVSAAAGQRIRHSLVALVYRQGQQDAMAAKRREMSDFGLYDFDRQLLASQGPVE